MNLQQIVNAVNKDIDDQLSFGDIQGWVNQCLNDLSSIAKYEKKATFTGKAFTLPSDCVEINSIKENGYIVPYERWGNEITLSETKTVDLYYYGELPELNNVNDIPQIPKAYHSLLVLYGVAKAKYQDDETEAQKIAWSEYLNKLEEFKSYINKQQNVSFYAVYTL